MDLYVLDERFRRAESVDKYNSVVWAERYNKAGDVTLMTSPTRAMQSLLSEGTFLGLDGSKEVMIIDTALIEDGALKVTGFTLTEFLKNRIIRVVTGTASASRMFRAASGDTSGASLDQSIEEQMNDLVGRLLVPGGDLATSALGIDGGRQVFENLTIDWTGAAGAGPPYDIVTFPFGDMYEAFVQVAETYGIGFTLYLDSATQDDYSLKFKAYRGKDRTSGQSENELVRFSPDLGSLRDTTQLRSIANYKNLAYVFPSTSLVESGMPNTPGVAFVDNGDVATGFDLRSIMLTADDITSDDTGGSPTVLLNMLKQRAKDALANNNYVKIVDGEVVPQGDYQFGVHYGLGDIIELDSGVERQNAQVTEYIRSQDSTGEREYPTISVVD